MIDKIFKLVIAGDGGVGKTSLTSKYITGVFNESTEVTIGVDFFIKEVTLEEMGTVRLQIWDFAGEERFRVLLPTYVNGANGVLFLYSITDAASLANFDKWLQILRAYDKHIPILLAGSKIDLEHMRKVQRSEAINIAKKKGCAGYVEVSAKEGVNVDETFNEITKVMWRHAQETD